MAAVVYDRRGSVLVCRSSHTGRTPLVAQTLNSATISAEAVRQRRLIREICFFFNLNAGRTCIRGRDGVRVIKRCAGDHSYAVTTCAIKMRSLQCLILAALCAVFVTAAFAQQRSSRVALVIGNANYPDASTPLSTTIRDARTLADEFRRSEFDEIGRAHV